MPAGDTGQPFIFIAMEYSNLYGIILYAYSICARARTHTVPRECVADMLLICVCVWSV